MIIAFTGLKGSGKSTLAKYIRRNRGINRRPLARPIYKMVEALLVYQGATKKEIAYLFGSGKEEPTPYLNGKTTRYALQTLGTEWGRELISKNLWVDAWERSRKKTVGSTVVDDMRFTNEAIKLRELGGILIRITREEDDRIDISHLSEIEQLRISVDHTITNDGTPEDMYHELITKVKL